MGFVLLPRVVGGFPAIEILAAVTAAGIISRPINELCEKASIGHLKQWRSLANGDGYGLRRGFVILSGKT